MEITTVNIMNFFNNSIQGRHKMKFQILLLYTQNNVFSNRIYYIKKF